MTYRPFAALFGFGLLATIAADASAQQREGEIPYPAGNHSFPIQGREVTITWDEGVIEATRENNAAPIRLDLDVSMDLTDLQASLVREIDGSKVNERCGNQLHVSGTRLLPQGGGHAELSANLNYQRWECAKTKIPETYCTDTWIKLPFGGKTKGVPNCTVRWNMKEAKTKLLSQSANVAMNLVPRIRNPREVGVDAHVTRADLSGFAGAVVDIFGWHSKVRDMVQREVEAELRKNPIAFGLPEDVEIVDLALRSVRFTDRGGGRLGAMVTARAQITTRTFVRLLRRLKHL